MTREILAAIRAASALALCITCAAAPVQDTKPRGRDGPSLAAVQQGEAPIASGASRDVTSEGHAFIEISSARDAYFVHEPIRVRLRFGIEQSLLKDHLVQLFRQQLDVPLQVEAPWLENLAGVKTLATEQPRSTGATARRSFVLNDSVGTAERVADRVELARQYAVFEIERTYVSDYPGRISIPPARLGFAIASRFEDDFVHGRVAIDRSNVFVRSAPLVLEIQALPEEGRPADFSGAVGHFTMRAEASPRELDVGQSLKLVLTIEGTGDLEAFHAPRLGGLEGFQVYGTVEENGIARRTITYDLAPTSERVREVPSIAFVVFDTERPAGYRTVRTQPISVEVRAPASRREPSQASAPAAEPLHEPSTARPFVIAAVSIAFVAFACWCFAMWKRRGRPKRESDSGAAALFRARIAGSDPDVARALTEYLAARLSSSPAAIVGSDVRAQLIACGISAELAARVAACFDQLVAARYGGHAPVIPHETVQPLVDELEARWPRTP